VTDHEQALLRLVLKNLKNLAAVGEKTARNIRAGLVLIYVYVAKHLVGVLGEKRQILPVLNEHHGRFLACHCPT
jgi:uroporphyrinogen-III synthase